MTSGEKFHISSAEVAQVIQAKKEGVEFIRIRNLFFNPKYIVSIAPNQELNESYPNGDMYFGNPDEILTGELKKLDTGTKQLS